MRATTAKGVSKQNSHLFKGSNAKMTIMRIFYGLVYISHMRPMLIKAIGFVIGVIELLC